LPVWRAFGNTAQTDPSGFKYVFSKDKSAVFVDARPKNEFDQGTIPGAVNMKSGEVEQANKDGRLPYHDHGARVIVFGSTAEQARQLAEEIAQRAYWNSSYSSGTYQELKQAGIW
jgi:rhodanese-related sulfurtransferase